MNPWASKSQAESELLVHAGGATARWAANGRQTTDWPVHPAVADAEHVGHCRVLARVVVVAARRSRWGPAHAHLPENGTRPTARP